MYIYIINVKCIIKKKPLINDQWVFLSLTSNYYAVIVYSFVKLNTALLLLSYRWPLHTYGLKITTDLTTYYHVFYLYK